MHADDSNQLQTKILFVDDEEIISRYFCRVCKPDFEVIIANNSASALEIMQQHGDSIAIVMTDQLMPGMTGSELLSEVKAKYPNVIRIITSGYISDSEMDDLMSGPGIFRYIVKPWDVDLLRATLFEAMNHFRAEYNI